MLVGKVTNLLGIYIHIYIYRFLIHSYGPLKTFILPLLYSYTPPNFLSKQIWSNKDQLKVWGGRDTNYTVYEQHGEQENDDHIEDNIEEEEVKSDEEAE